VSSLFPSLRSQWSERPFSSYCLTLLSEKIRIPCGVVEAKLVNRRVFALALVIGLFASLLSLTPAQAGKPDGSSTCPLPPTDFCNDYITRGRLWVSMPIPYYVNLAGAPLGALEDIQDAFSTWQNEVKSPALEADPRYTGDHSRVSFVFMGPTDVAAQRQDGVNVVYFQSSVGGASSTATWSSGKTIREFDIVVNTSYTWTTDLTCPTHTCGTLDLQNVLTHEIGHVLDLYHVTAEGDAELTMYPGASPDEMKKRDLGAGEILALRRLYPA
jgi:hypothetical protein